MKIGQKLTLAFGGVALLFGVAGYISIHASKDALQKSIGESSISLAAGILDSIDRTIYNRIEDFQAYVTSLTLQKIIKESNEKFEKLNDIQTYIAQKDREWTSVPKETVTAFMQELVSNELAEELKQQLKFYEEKYGYKVLGEVFVTNKYGVNIAQTGKTTDYYQADEQWWQVAREKGLYVTDVEYDESSGMYSTNIGIRITDKDGNFLGVMKIVLNVENVIEILRKAKEASPYKTAQFKLFNRSGKLIFDRAEEYNFLKDITNEETYSNIRSNGGHLLKRGENDEGEELFVYALSKGYKDYQASGWILAIEYQTEEIFAPVVKLKNVMLIVPIVIAVALLIGLYVSRNISKPVKKLRDAAVEISKGKFGTTIEVDSENEIGELADSFNKMAQHLKKTVDNLNQEITERKKTEEALRKNEEFTRRVIESSNDCIKVLDLQGRLLSMSGGGQKLLEINDITPYLNSSFVDFWKSKEREDCLKAISKARQGDTGIFYGYFETAKGVPKWWEVIVTPIKDADGSINCLLAVSRDITERKRAEQRQDQLLKQLEKTNQELRNFVHLTSHDLKTPLRGIKTLADWILTDYADKLDDDGKRRINLLMNRTRRMYNLIEGILQYSRIGYIREEKIVVNLNELIAEVIDMIDPPEHITITIENELPLIKCEKTFFIQVFQNLLSNAVNYMDKPKGRIKVGCIEENSFWKFSVADNGPGIEEKHFERIFEMFQTLTPRDKFESTGVGLTIIKRIIEMYGGRIWVQSKIGEGSTFFFTLPKQEIRIEENEELRAGVIG